MPVITRFKKEFLAQREKIRSLFDIPKELTVKVSEMTVRREGKPERITLEEIRGLPALKMGTPMTPQAKFQLMQAGLTENERLAFIQAYGSSIRQWATYFPEDERWQLERTPALIKKSAKPGEQLHIQYLVARKEDGTAVGHCFTSTAQAGRVALGAFIFVKPDYKGAGLAQAIYKHRLDFARRHGATHLFVETEPYGAEEHDEYRRLSGLSKPSLSEEQKRKLDELEHKRRRLAFDAKMGFQVDPNWTHASLLEGKKPVPLWLLVKPLTQKPVTSTEMRLKQIALYKQFYHTPPGAAAAVTEANIGKALHLVSPAQVIETPPRAKPLRTWPSRARQ
ncbi:GNAT family N-acetyltransferase [Candidatus Micrarchaeota archaeon]|nr:GNAT family N-acetyltransferase [Candidatus Micrarchaeota archaeon]